jgi:hypothetical protein
MGCPWKARDAPSTLRKTLSANTFSSSPPCGHASLASQTRAKVPVETVSPALRRKTSRRTCPEGLQKDKVVRPQPRRLPRIQLLRDLRQRYAPLLLLLAAVVLLLPTVVLLTAAVVLLRRQDVRLHRRELVLRLRLLRPRGLVPLLRGAPRLVRRLVRVRREAVGRRLVGCGGGRHGCAGGDENRRG